MRVYPCLANLDDALRLQRGNDLIDDRVRLCAHFLIVGILNGMSHKYTLRIHHPQCLCLGLCCIDKL